MKSRQGVRPRHPALRGNHQEHPLRDAAESARLCRPHHPRRGQSGENRPGQDPEQGRDGSPIRPTRPKSARPWTAKPRPARIAIRASGRSNKFPRASGPGRSKAPTASRCSAAWKSSVTSRLATTPPAISTRRRRPSSACSTSSIRSMRSIERLRTSTLGIAGFSLAFIAVRFAVGRLLRAPPGLSAAARPRKRGATTLRRKSGPADSGAQQRRIRQTCLVVQRHDRRPAQFARATARLGPYARAKSGKPDAGAAPRAGGDHARRKARLGRAAGLGRRARIEQSADRHPDLLASVAAENAGQERGCGGHGPGHPRNQAMRGDHQAAARFCP